jgi:hypothetical protein
MDLQASATLVLPLSIFQHLACRHFVELHGREDGHHMARIYTGQYKQKKKRPKFFVWNSSGRFRPLVHLVHIPCATIKTISSTPFCYTQTGILHPELTRTVYACLDSRRVRVPRRTTISKFLTFTHENSVIKMKFGAEEIKSNFNSL